MKPAYIESRIIALLEPILHRERIQLCGVRVGGGRRRPLIQVYIDLEEAPIPVDACAMVSRQLQDSLNLQVQVLQDYRLVVSSPGLDWPLSEAWQFRKNTGRSIKLARPDGELQGCIRGITSEGEVELEVEGVNRRFSISELTGAKLIITVPSSPKHRRKRTNEA